MPTRIEGLDHVRKALQDTPKEARAVLRNVVVDTVRIVAQRTAQAAPFETGALRQAIVGQPPTRSGLNGYVAIDQGTFHGRQPSSYVLALEYGKGPGARPFIRSTAERESAPYVSRLQRAGKEIERNLSAIGGRNL